MYLFISIHTGDKTMANKTVKNLLLFENLTGIHFTVDHTGKMRGMHSLSSSCLCNAHCLKRIKRKNLICAYCYAAAMHKNYKDLARKLRKNTSILTMAIIPVETWPVIFDEIFRLEAFGDINNEIQQINYFNFCYGNPNTIFAQWTKNPWIIDKVIKAGHEKPKNLIIIFSDPRIDAMPPEKILERFPFIDKIFSVYTREYAKENGIEINCGARNCNKCRACYSLNGPVFIRELLKTGGQTKDDLIDKILYSNGHVTKKYVYRVIHTGKWICICRMPRGIDKKTDDFTAMANYKYHAIPKG